MDMLKLVALDEEDLAIISAHVQDAVMKVERSRSPAADEAVRPDDEPLRLGGRRRRRAAGNERRRSVLTFARVLAAKCAGIDPSARRDEVLSLLAVRFVASDAPTGTVELVFSGGASIRLDVECIEAQARRHSAAPGRAVVAPRRTDA